MTCAAAQFACENGRCIPNIWKCDSVRIAVDTKFTSVWMMWFQVIGELKSSRDLRLLKAWKITSSNVRSTNLLIFRKTIAAMEATKETSALRRLARTSSSLVLEPVIAFHNLGCVMATTTASINRQ